MNIKNLLKPFKIEEHMGRASNNSEGTNMLCYIDARNVMDRLDEVCGQENGQASYQDGGKICTISIKINDQGVSKANGADETDIEEVKGQMSDSFKRAAVLGGIGRYLYDLKNYNTVCKAVTNPSGKINSRKTGEANKNQLNAALTSLIANYSKEETPTTIYDRNTEISKAIEQLLKSGYTNSQIKIMSDKVSDNNWNPTAKEFIEAFEIMIKPINTQITLPTKPGMSDKIVIKQFINEFAKAKGLSPANPDDKSYMNSIIEKIRNKFGTDLTKLVNKKDLEILTA